ncbi:MAG: DNA primase [Bacteroidota bacterium]
MISKDTIAKIFETARIEEVVGEFVTLKKRGVNMLGRCPFHNEKTPSFTVSPAKGIYKCFGCGKAGNSVNFIMEHEHYTYPEALKYLAKKYNIDVEEDAQTSESIEADNAKESLYLISTYAASYFALNLHEQDEGKAIGLTYFRERGFSDATIEKFQLGYSLTEWGAFTEAALAKGYQVEYLEKTGLTIVAENGRQYDRFRGRVMFPIHNLSGRVIGFGGRIIKTDPKSPKYVNSPESDIYHKGNILYGAYQAKKSIIQTDNCYLVEGYTDVISMHQSGVENVVASSGTSLTIEQIRLISRYTKNVTVLYDSDPAGIKASLRGIDLILEEGLNVRVVLFPEGDDPDSYSKKVGAAELKEYINGHSVDFILFKTNLLLGETKGDPIKKAELIKDIISSIAKIPDPIFRSTYLKECSSLLGVDEKVLIAELNKLRRKSKLAEDNEVLQPTEDEIPQVEQPRYNVVSTEPQERDLIRLLIAYGKQELELPNPDYHKPTEDEEVLEKQEEFMKITVAEFLTNELVKGWELLKFENRNYELIMEEFIQNLKKDFIPDFLQIPKLAIR